ncbi:vWA domain-containing protein [Rhodococcus gannanensis]|uniref:VWA domain-containing protein n=1 Tax=Rhodococcus gannanensis TaxID=1960308 RepID=A0ABW4P1Q6_9NOCA
MADTELTRLVFLLDRSGSMQSIKSDIEGGFAAFVEEQKAADGSCLVTLVQFDDDYHVVYQNVPVSEAPPLDLRPRGRTALLDAMGRLVTELGAEINAQPEDERPGAVIVAIMTDGHENASRKWTHAAVKDLVDLHTRTSDWQFMYMGADQDAIEVGAQLGVAREQSLTYRKGNSRAAMEAAGKNIRDYREAKMINPAAAMPLFSDEQRDAAGN